nr:transposase [uncultured Brevundimonas sp.]
MEGEVLRDDQWSRIEPFVPGGRKGKRGPRSNGRLFVDALLWMARSGGDPVIPPRRHRKRQHAYDKALYKERNRVERFFSRVKHFRRIATRYDKLASTFRGFITLATIMLGSNS